MWILVLQGFSLPIESFVVDSLNVSGYSSSGHETSLPMLHWNSLQLELAVWKNRIKVIWYLVSLVFLRFEQWLFIDYAEHIWSSACPLDQIPLVLSNPLFFNLKTILFWNRSKKRNWSLFIVFDMVSPLQTA